MSVRLNVPYTSRLINRTGGELRAIAIPSYGMYLNQLHRKEDDTNFNSETVKEHMHRARVFQGF